MTTLEPAVEQFAAGLPVLVGDVDDHTIFVAVAADSLRPEHLATLQELGRGPVVLGLGEPQTDRLQLRITGPRAAIPAAMRLTTPIDAASGITAGWSLADRARTIRVAGSPTSGPSDVVIPGHVLTARIEDRGRGAAPAALELARLADRGPAVALCVVLDAGGGVARLNSLSEASRWSRVARASTAELRARMLERGALEDAAACELPTGHGHFRAVGLSVNASDPPALALVCGDPATRSASLVHIHIACRFGDTFGSLLCDCRRELDAAADAIATEGAGAIVYVQPACPGAAFCPRDEPIDLSLAAGLLRAAGVAALRPTPRTARLATELTNLGLEVHVD